MKIKQIILILILTACSPVLYSQNNSTYNFLKLDVDARSASLAGSFISAENDVNILFYNPAGIATLEKSQISAGFFKYLLDINSGNAAYAMKYKDYGYFSAGIRYINYGSFDKYDENFNNTGTFSANDIALSLGYANGYDGKLFYGANAKLIYSNIDEFTSTGLAVDLGLMYKLVDYNANFGISLLNLGTQMSSYMDTKEKLPLELRIGSSVKLEYLPLNFSFSFNNIVEDTDEIINRFKNFSLGGEFTLSDYLNLRLGYNNQNRQNLKTGSSIGIGGFSAGIGFRYEDKYFVDYGFNSMGKIGATHRINLRYILE
ncbi:MAG: type IX secretion system protein PorQ [Ignavibacteria bacterium]|nr:type IX secretion system protein PorQ [Ignavibacteria bacterium]